jgi:hypothetical protein
MCLRWTAAGMLEAEQQFRKIIGFSDLGKLAIAVERDVAARGPPPSRSRSRASRARLSVTRRDCEPSMDIVEMPWKS